ncbi:MAG: hypothetical protein ACQEP1_05350 [Nanobdellota archaeon]
MKRHLKILNVPRTWSMEKKGTPYVLKPLLSRSPENSVTLKYVFKNMLGIAMTKKEVSDILQNNYIFVNGVRKNDPKDILGLMDVLQIKSDDRNYRLILNEKGKFELVKISEKESALRPSKIIGKSILKGGKVQLNFMNGYNVMVDKDEYKVGDVLVLELPSKKIRDKISMEKGAYVYLVGGSHVGVTGKIVDFDNTSLILKKGKDELKTHRKYAYPIGKEKPVISFKSK